MSEFNYWVPLRALLLGLLAIALSFIAYARRVRASEVHNINGICTYPNGSAWYFGLMAAIALLASQLAICVGMKCFCCNRNVHFTKKCIAVISMIFFVLSWIAFVIAFTGLIITAIVNNHDFLEKQHPRTNSGGTCFTSLLEPLFLSSAIWCIITTVFGQISYSIWACSIDRRDNIEQVGYAHSYEQGDQGVAMGQPLHTQQQQLPKEQC